MGSNLGGEGGGGSNLSTHGSQVDILHLIRVKLGSHLVGLGQKMHEIQVRSVPLVFEWWMRARLVPPLKLQKTIIAMGLDVDADPDLEETEAGIIMWIWNEISSSWINMLLTLSILYILYKILFQKEDDQVVAAEPPPPPLAKQDMSLEQLRVYDGESASSEGRICVAVNGKIFGVTRGKRFYGPGGPYSGFAGRDASRGLATFSVEPVSDQYDDLSDLKPSEMEQVQEWDLQFSEKYDLVGKLLKPGEDGKSYSDVSEDDSEVTSTSLDENYKDK